MSAYYSTLNNSSGNTIPGNFGISNAIRIGVQGNVPTYNYGLNNAGLLPQSAAVSTQTNVLMGLLSGKDANGLGTTTALAQSAQQAVTLIPIDTKFNGNLPNPTHPRIQAYPNETSFNTYQN
jgi:hypothetical protein